MIHYDCRYYVGRKPCKFKRACEGCPNHDPIEQRILVIKLGALGDLLRTTCILPSLKLKYPKSQITWITTKACAPLLQNLPEIDRIWITDSHVSSRVLAEHFDIMICFDKDTPAVELATISRATIKKGFGLSPDGSIMALNEGSQYALELGIDDHLKFKVNQKSYQQIIHEMADFPPAIKVPHYQLRLTDEELTFGADWIKTQYGDGKRPPILGVNPGAGRVFATKKWLPERYLFLIFKLYQEHGVVPMLVGGKDEVKLLNRMHEQLKSRGVPVLRPGEEMTLRQFSAIVAQADGMLCGDTLAMHVALAFKVPTVAVFTSTCVQEIEMYGVGQAIVGTAPCSPCYLAKCKQPSQICAENVSVDAVFEAVVGQLRLAGRENVRRHSNI